MIRPALRTLGMLACATAPAAAQVLGLPVVNNGAATGLSVGAEVGFANAEYFGGGTAIGGRASIGLGFFGVSAAISHFSPKGGNGTWAPGASATLRLLGGPLVPFRITMQAGASRWTLAGTDYVHVPLSIGLAATIPNPAIAIKPWIAPRIDYLHSSVTGIINPSDFHFGISGGVDVSLLSGLAIRAAYDQVSSGGSHPGIFSLGLGFAP